MSESDDSSVQDDTVQRNPLYVEDVATEILSYLPARTLFQIGKLCRTLRYVTREENTQLWRQVWNNHTLYKDYDIQGLTQYLGKTYRQLCKYKVFQEKGPWNALNLPEFDSVLASNVDAYKDGFIWYVHEDSFAWSLERATNSFMYSKYNLLNAPDGPIEFFAPEGTHIVRVMISDSFITAVTTNAFHVFSKDQKLSGWRMDVPFLDETTGRPEPVLNYWVHKDVVVLAKLSANHIPLNSISVYDLKSIVKYLNVHGDIPNLRPLMTSAEVPTPFDPQIVHPAVHRDAKGELLLKMELLATGQNGQSVVIDLNSKLEVVGLRKLQSNLKDLSWGSIHETGLVLFISRNKREMEFLWDIEPPPPPRHKVAKSLGLKLKKKMVKDDSSETASVSSGSGSGSGSIRTNDYSSTGHFLVRKKMKIDYLDDTVIDCVVTESALVLHQYGTGSSFNRPHARVRVIDLFTGELIASTHYKTHTYALALRLTNSGVVRMDGATWKFMFRPYTISHKTTELKLGDLYLTLGQPAVSGGTGRTRAISNSRSRASSNNDKPLGLSSSNSAYSSPKASGKARKLCLKYDDELDHLDDYYDEQDEQEEEIEDEIEGGTVPSQHPTEYLNKSYKWLLKYKCFVEAGEWNNLALGQAKDQVLVRDPTPYENQNILAVSGDSLAWGNVLSPSFSFATLARLNSNVEDAILEFQIPSRKGLEAVWISDTFVCALTDDTIYVYSKDPHHRLWHMDIPAPVVDDRGRPRPIDHFWINQDVIIAKYDEMGDSKHSIWLFDLHSIRKYLNPKEALPGNPRPLMTRAEVELPFEAYLFHIAVNRNAKRDLESLALLVAHNSKAVVYDMDASLNILKERRTRTTIRDITWGSIESNGMLLFVGGVDNSMEILFDHQHPSQVGEGSMADYTSHFRLRKIIKSNLLEDRLKDVICTATHVILHQAARQSNWIRAIFEDPSSKVRVYDIYSGDLVANGHFRTMSPGHKLFIDHKGVTWIEAVSHIILSRPYAATKKSKQVATRTGRERSVVPGPGFARKVKQHSIDDHNHSIIASDHDVNSEPDYNSPHDYESYESEGVYDDEEDEYYNDDGKDYERYEDLYG
ncbi:hypothetical protein SmJEL517_g00177 [Synchytrium microbalum]|uniref:F-box domain-containing protein n=1 Tax=Synchytrium microbalum TaxID=1806994 RepID=A0A507CKB4_9FUNG|nr:uncharacterized protein SmJEL517_g00177 [Synchytrium microbalum]TPX38345.1 hypothetical protein SmJEL517_g00177 [Synchytrium microbalum]